MNEAMPTIDPLAVEILTRLAGRPEASEIVLGGYFALQQYLGHRETHDIDAWWRTLPRGDTEAVLREVVADVAAGRAMTVRERRFGDTLSLEMLREGKKCFSVQIAVRSVTLDEPLLSPWPPVLIETLHDNMGSKMNALVDRGAPRDFVDIYSACEARLVTSALCWGLWAKKNPGSSIDAAKQKVLFHLSGLEARRPLTSIADFAEREQAENTRSWFRAEFVQ